MCTLWGLLHFSPEIYLQGGSKVQYTNVSYASLERKTEGEKKPMTSSHLQILLSHLRLESPSVWRASLQPVCLSPTRFSHCYKNNRLPTYLSLSSQSTCCRNRVSRQNPSHHGSDLGHRKSTLGRNMGAMSRSDGLRDVWHDRPRASRGRDEF